MKGKALAAAGLLAASGVDAKNNTSNLGEALDPAPEVLNVSGEVKALANDVVTAEVATFTQEGLDEVRFEVSSDVDTLMSGALEGEDFEPQCEGDPGLHGFLSMVKEAYMYLAEGTEVTEADILAYIENDLERFISWHESNVEDAIDFEEAYEDQITLAYMKQRFDVSDIQLFLSIQESRANIAESEANIAESEANIAESEANIAESEANIAESEKNIAESEANIEESKERTKKIQEEFIASLAMK